jgi:predicted Zn-dependent protease
MTFCGKIVPARLFQAALLLTFCLSTGELGASVADNISALREAPTRAGANSPASQSQLERLRRVMLPLLRASDHPQRLDQVRIRIVDDPSLNAGSAGNGVFIVTTGLLNKATDDQLRGVLAHEIAHDDLGHAARAQVLLTGLGLGVGLLEQIIPGSSAITPLAGTLIARNYSRPQEYEADRHAVKILRRSGYSKDVMIDTLTWLKLTSGDNGGGFLSTHPAISERIQALRTLR